MARLIAKAEWPLHLAKLAGALALIGMSIWALFVVLKPMLATDAVVDQGPRDLVVLATKGGSEDYAINFKSHVNAQGRYSVTFYVTADNIKYGDGGNDFTVDFAITFAGPSIANDVTCGTSLDPIPRQSFSNLPAGVQAALRLDSIGTDNSATNYDGTGQLGPISSGIYPEFIGKLWVLNTGSSYSERAVSADAVWAESCTLPMKSVWRQAGHDGPLQGERRTLLVPQFNITSLDASTDHQQNMTSVISVDRASGMSLSEGYPDPQTTAVGWYYNSVVSWNGKLGETSNVGFTDQPVFIFSNRSLPTQQALAILAAGAAVGVIGTLLVSVLSRLADLGWSWWKGWALDEVAEPVQRLVQGGPMRPSEEGDAAAAATAHRDASVEESSPAASEGRHKSGDQP